MNVTISEKPSTVVVALSGGLDSSVSAALLKIVGWEVSGLHFLLPAATSVEEARQSAVQELAEFLHIPFKIVDMREAFSRQVMDPFLEAYLQGLTPNPCVMCNPLVKFSSLLRFAEQNHIHRVATGHYVRLRKKDDGPVVELLRGRDKRKDQSYFLHRLRQTCLSRTLFPLGELTKDQVAQKARDVNLPVISTPESQDICFLPDGDYRSLLESQRGGVINRHGNIINIHGEIIGEHRGIHRYTIGQRQGLGIASHSPYYVQELKPKTNEVIAGRKEDLFSNTAEAINFTWVEAPPLGKKLILQAQVRYRHRAATGLLEVLSTDRVKFTFENPQWAITPGQFLCCYDGDRVIGGGVICRPRSVGKARI